MSPEIRVTVARPGAERAWIVEATRGTYWGRAMTEAQIETSLEHSLCFVAKGGHLLVPVGFLRILTDHATVSTITDLFVDEKWRRQGVGTRLVQTALDHPWVRSTICILESRDAKNLYERLGFVLDMRGVMKRNPA